MFGESYVRGLIVLVVFGVVAPSWGAAAAEKTYPRVEAAIGYEVDAAWPQRPAGVTWDGCPGITVDAKDRIYVYTRGTPPIQIYDPSGKYLGGFGQDVIKSAHHIKVDREGNIWAPDVGAHVVRKLSPEGKVLMTLGTEGKAGLDNSHFDQPTDVAIAPNGDIFVADGYGNDRIVHFSKAGKFVKAWGKLGSKPGEFSIPHSVAFDSKGRLYVADRNNVRVQVFDQKGKFLAQWRNIMVPWGIFITPKDEVWVCGSTPMRWPKGDGAFGYPPKDQIFVRFNTDGKVMQIWSVPSAPAEGQAKPGEGALIHGFGVDSKGNVYVGEISSKRTQKFLRVE